MYARITTAQGRPGETDQVLSLWREYILPQAKQQQGFKEALVIGDRATGKTYSVTLWESEADAQRTLTSDLMRDILARVAPLVTAPPTQENLEVLLHEEA